MSAARTLRSLRARLRKPLVGWTDAGLLVGLLLLAVAVGAAQPWLFLLGWALATVADWTASDWDRPSSGTWLMRTLRANYGGWETRAAVRELLLLALLARTGQPGLTVAVVVFVLLRLERLPAGRLIARTLRTRNQPLLTRNIDLTDWRISDSPRVHLRAAATQSYLVCAAFGAAGAALAAGTGAGWCRWAGYGLTLLGGLVWIAVVRSAWRANRATASPERAFELLQRWVRDYRPQTVLHISGVKGSGYQCDMWFEALEALDGPVLLVVRERYLLDELDATALPMLCVPDGGDLMRLDLSSVRVVLYTGNVGTNIGLLRLPTAKQVFIGHGDSDKSASVNPYSKVYDEIWTAGQAGADRYLRAQVGVQAEDVVGVGRPQLDTVSTRVPEGPVTTVLYAPTWEGWYEEPGCTSLAEAGGALVRELLAAPGRVRVLYRPHPLTGRRLPRMTAADNAVRELLARANTGRDQAPPTAAQSAARVELAEVRRELAALAARGGRPGADVLECARDGITTPETVRRIAELRRREAELYWASAPATEHRVVAPGDIALYPCFNESHALVSDISSVVSDFVASGKPYAITDVVGLGEAEFRRRNTAARAAQILDVRGGGIAELLAVLRGEAPDELAEQRRELRTYLLGPAEPASQLRFNAAVVRLAAEAEERNRLRLAEQEGTAPARSALVGSAAHG